jgi:streptogramin lyase
LAERAGGLPVGRQVDDQLLFVGGRQLEGLPGSTSARVRRLGGTSAAGDAAAAAAGRDPREIRTIFNFPGQITDQPLAATGDSDGRWIGGSAGQWAEELAGAVLEHGAAGFMLFSPDGATPDTVSLTRWAREIAPAVRETIAKERN